MGQIPEGRKPLTWADIDFGDRPRGHPSTERLEIEKLQEEICRQKEYKEDYKAAYIEVSEEHERLRAENERLREGLRRIARLEQKGSKSAGQRVTTIGKIARDAMSERAAPLSELRDQARPAKADAREQDMPDSFWDGAEMRPAEGEA